MARVMPVKFYRREAPPLPWKIVRRRLKKKAQPYTVEAHTLVFKAALKKFQYEIVSKSIEIANSHKRMMVTRKHVLKAVAHYKKMREPFKK